MRVSPEAAIRVECRHCGARILWAKTEGRGLSLELDPEEDAVGQVMRLDPLSDYGDGDDTVIEFTGGDDWDGADLVFTGETVQGARGEVPLVRYVRPGTGTHSVHRCQPGS